MYSLLCDETETAQPVIEIDFQQLRQNTSRLPISKCMPVTVTQDIHNLEYNPSLLCNPCLELST